MPPADSDHDRDSEAQERAEAGAARSGRRSRVGLIVTILLVALALVAARGAGLGQGGSSDDSDGSDGRGRGADRSSTTAPDAATATSADGAATTAPGPAQGTTSSSVSPPDVAAPRPTVDLATRPPATDPLEVARWWAATFVAYSPAEPAADLVARLDPYTTTRLRDALLAVPPAASYDVPVEIAGVSAQEAPGARAGSRQFTVSVETPGALVVYRLNLMPASTGWQVDEANRL